MLGLSFYHNTAAIHLLRNSIKICSSFSFTYGCKTQADVAIVRLPISLWIILLKPFTLHIGFRSHKLPYLDMSVQG